jgi:hypothetical protein
MNAAPAGEQGQASSLYATARAVGQSLSVALAGTVFAGLGGASAGSALVLARNGSGVPGDVAALGHAFVIGFRGTLLVCAAVAAVGIFAALVRGDERVRPRLDPAAADAARPPIPQTAR